MVPKISIVTPSFNSAKYIEECIQSVLQQGYPNLEYIIIDGDSTDGTTDIIEKYRGQLAYFASEKDSGPAEALNKGFAQSTGDIMCWLNTDDRLHSRALFAVADVFSHFDDVDWIIGYPTWYNSDGASLAELFLSGRSFFYSNNFVNDTFHLKFAHWSKWRFAAGDFNSIQQESVFWRRTLWEKSGGYLRAELVAFDLELWTRFFEHARLHTCNALLGGFRVHGNQVSINQRERYMKESADIIGQFKNVLLKGNSSQLIKVKLARAMRFFYYYNFPLLSKAYPMLMDLPRFITFNPSLQKFEKSRV